LTVSVLQAITQVQEMTLSFVPKILGAFIILTLVMPWMLKVAVSFAATILSSTNLFIE
jgi:flagellar biosynthetic protein FliQ